MEGLPDGSQANATTTVRTPGCADRLTVSVPPTRLYRGYPLIVAVREQLAAGQTERALSMLTAALNEIDSATDVVVPARPDG